VPGSIVLLPGPNAHPPASTTKKPPLP
jgi:hypothetical protein